MRAIIAFWLCMLLTCVCCVQDTTQRVTVYPNSHIDRIKSTYQSVYLVTEKLKLASVKDKSVSVDLDAYTGTAWSIASNWVDSVFVTAGHVCDAPGDLVSPSSIVVQVDMSVERNGLEYPAKIILDNDKLDIDQCLLYVKNLSTDPLRLATLEPVEGDRVFYVGFPVQMESIVDGYYVTVTDTNFQQASLLAAGGASGSPVLNELGQVYGMLTRVNTRFPVDSYATRLSTLLPLAEKARVALVAK